MSDSEERWGGACYWCYWGWPKKIYEIYTEALEALGGDSNPLKYGPAHIVWEDENWDSAQWCLDNFDDYTWDLDAGALDIVKESLLKLVEIADEFVEPEGYKGNNPENFPPPASWEMVKEDERGKFIE